MDERIRKRRRSVRLERGRGRRATVFLVVLLLCALAAYLSLRSTDVFAVTRVTATGAEQTAKGQIAAITAGAIGDSLLSLSTDSIREALLGLPYVESAEVHRGFPNTLEIELAEYEPVARLQVNGGDTWLVSDSGKVLEGAEGGRFSDLPLVVPDSWFSVIVGEQVPAAIADALPLAALVRGDEMRSRLPVLARIAVSAAGCATLVLKDGGVLRLGTPEGLDRKLGVAVDIVQQCLKQGRIIEYIDASVADRVAVKAK
jgi:cell division septal protein FtsQ